MENKLAIIKRPNNIFLVIFILVGMMIGLFTTQFALNGPFGEFSNAPLVDLTKVTILILLSACLLYFIAKNTSKSLVIIILSALLVRLFVVVLMSFFGFLPYQYDNNWDVDAGILLSDWNSGNFHFDLGNSNASFYSILTTIIYFLFGENPIYMQLLNVFFSSLTIYYIFKITNHLFNHKIAVFTSGIMAIWPSYIFFSSMHMREALAIFSLVTFAFFFMKWLRYLNFKYMVIATLCFILNILIRDQNAILISISVLPFIIFYAWKYSSKYLKINILILTLTFGTALLVIFNASGYLNFDFNYIATEMNYRSNGGSSYLEWMTYGSIFDVIIYAPIRFIYFTYTPFPWQITDMAQAFAFLESILLIVMSLYILRNYKKLRGDSSRKRELLFIITFCILGLLANGVVDSNVGTSIRHKLQYIFLFFILFSAIKYNKSKSNRKSASISGMFSKGTGRK